MEKSTLTTVNKYRNTGDLLQVYSKYRNDDTFLLGYFIETMGSYLIFQSIDEYGALDGYTLLAKSDIADIITDTNYTNIYKNYVKQQKARNSYDLFNLKKQYDFIPKKDISSMLKFCCQHKNVVMLSCTAYESSRGGQVISVNDDYIVLDQIKYYADWDMDEISIKQNDKIEIKQILALDIISKDNFLYEQYLKSLDNKNPIMPMST